jgi:hypothetical protein
MIEKEGNVYVAPCPKLDVASQGGLRRALPARHAASRLQESRHRRRPRHARHGLPLLTHKTTYHDPGADYSDRHRTERTRRRAIQALERQGYRVILEPPPEREVNPSGDFLSKARSRTRQPTAALSQPGDDREGDEAGGDPRNAEVAQSSCPSGPHRSIPERFP